MNKRKKILVIRNDKIGDFMLSWPSFALLKKQYPETEITALVPEYTAPLAEKCEWIDKVLIDNKKKSFIPDVLSLAKKIKQNNYDLSISLFSESRTSASLWLARVKKRIGPATKLAQIFLNDTVRQKRSQSKKPEYEYNLDLIRYFIKNNGDTPIQTPEPPFLIFDKSETNIIKNSVLEKYSIPRSTKLVFIHPGTGGSAINLSAEQYAKLVLGITTDKDIYIIITAGPGELPIAEKLSGLLKETKHHIHYSTSGIIDFCKFISICDVFISGSTGPLHIAAALNKRTVAFYPSKKSATSLRWRTINTEEKQLMFTLGDENNQLNSLIDLGPVSQVIKNKYFKDSNGR